MKRPIIASASPLLITRQHCPAFLILMEHMQPRLLVLVNTYRGLPGPIHMHLHYESSFPHIPKVRVGIDTPIADNETYLLHQSRKDLTDPHSDSFQDQRLDVPSEPDLCCIFLPQILVMDWESAFGAGTVVEGCLCERRSARGWGIHG